MDVPAAPHARHMRADAIRDAGIFNVARVNELRARILVTKTPNNLNDYHHLMKLEWVMTLVLTIQMLHRQFVRKEWACSTAESRLN